MSVKLKPEQVFLVQGRLPGETKVTEVVVVTSKGLLAEATDFVAKAMPQLAVVAGTPLTAFQEAERKVRESLAKKPGALPLLVVPVAG